MWEALGLCARLTDVPPWGRRACSLRLNAGRSGGKPGTGRCRPGTRRGGLAGDGGGRRAGPRNGESLTPRARAWPPAVCDLEKPLAALLSAFSLGDGTALWRGSVTYGKPLLSAHRRRFTRPVCQRRSSEPGGRRSAGAGRGPGPGSHGRGLESVRGTGCVLLVLLFSWVCWGGVGQSRCSGSSGYHGDRCPPTQHRVPHRERRHSSDAVRQKTRTRKRTFTCGK